MGEELFRTAKWYSEPVSGATNVVPIPPPEVGARHWGDRDVVHFETSTSSWWGFFGVPKLSNGVHLARVVFGGKRAIIIAGGQGYMVRPSKTAEYVELSPVPAYHLYVDEASEVAYVVGPYSLAAYSAEGMLWRTDRLVIDDLRIHSVDEQFVHCVGFVPPGVDRRFELKRDDGEPVIRDGDDWRY